MNSMLYPFTEKEMQAAHDIWGCNCGPSALAFALQVKLDVVRHAIPGFEEKQYTSPSMMKAALSFLNRGFSVVTPPRFIKGSPFSVESLFHESPALVRIQWCGPWTAPAANPKWAYRQTHWICTWEEGIADGGGANLVFDCNGGIMGFGFWESDVVPLIVKNTPRADGEWFPTHIWRIRGERRVATKQQ